MTSQAKSIAHDSICVRLCKIATRLARLPPLRSFPPLPGSTTVRAALAGLAGGGDSITRSLRNGMSPAIHSATALSLASAFFHGSAVFSTLVRVEGGRSIETGAYREQIKRIQFIGGLLRREEKGERREGECKGREGEGGTPLSRPPPGSRLLRGPLDPFP